jgi:hypothetical protein
MSNSVFIFGYDSVRTDSGSNLKLMANPRGHNLESSKVIPDPVLGLSIIKTTLWYYNITQPETQGRKKKKDQVSQTLGSF